LFFVFCFCVFVFCVLSADIAAAVYLTISA
jgi:hypothetical protein